MLLVVNVEKGTTTFGTPAADVLGLCAIQRPSRHASQQRLHHISSSHPSLNGTSCLANVIKLKNGKTAKRSYSYRRKQELRGASEPVRKMSMALMLDPIGYPGNVLHHPEGRRGIALTFLGEHGHVHFSPLELKLLA